VLSGYFKFCQRQYRIERNPCAEVYLDAAEVDQSEVEAYTVEEVRRIMDAAAAHPNAARVLPPLAIGLFCGLRPAEVLGLDWSAVSLGQRQIRVTPATAKRRRQRFVEIPPNLARWLAPFSRESGPVQSSAISFRRDRREVLEAAGVSRWLHDGLRHSYGTYHLAAFEDAAKTAMQMGHRDNADLVFTHYRKLVSKDEALKFWQIAPEERK
jgi:integrase